MSQENVEMVRAGYDAFNRGDIEAALSPLHPTSSGGPPPMNRSRSRIGVTTDMAG